MMIPRLFPVMEGLSFAAPDESLPRADFVLDLVPVASPSCPRAGHEIRWVSFWLRDRGHDGFPPPLMAGFHDHVAARQVLQKFGERFAPVQSRCDLLSIGARELKENVRADRENRGAHLHG